MKHAMAFRFVLGISLVVCAFSLWAPPASAQAVYGSVFGTLTDAQGAAVAGAKVTVTSTAKGTSDTTTTNETGNYTVTHLIPDTYNLKAIYILTVNRIQALNQIGFNIIYRNNYGYFTFTHTSYYLCFKKLTG